MKVSCPVCDAKFDPSEEEQEEKMPKDDEMMEDDDLGEDEDMKKSIFDEMFTMGQEARKSKLPKKSEVAVEVMKVAPKKR